MKKLLILLFLPMMAFSQHYQCKGLTSENIDSSDPAKNFKTSFETEAIIIVDHERRKVSFKYYDIQAGADNEITLNYLYCERLPGKETLVCHSLQGVVYRCEVDQAHKEIEFSYYTEVGLYIQSRIWKFDIIEITNYTARTPPDVKYKGKQKPQTGL